MALLGALIFSGVSRAYPAVTPFAASSDQVLVIYNADFQKRSEGSVADQDSREVAEYYVAMHTDPKTGEKPYLLGLTCRHFRKSHLNDWVIREESGDNTNGISFRGRGPGPKPNEWPRDSRRVEIWVSDPDADWNSVRITCRSDVTGDVKVVTPLLMGFKVTGIPAKPGEVDSYPPVADGKGRSFIFDASRLFPGTVTVSFIIRNRRGEVIRDLSLRYYDVKDFVFSATGPDGIPDDAILEEDVLKPVRRFLEDPKNALDDGTLLKDHILYIVVVHGMPFAANGVFGVAKGVIGGEHGSRSSLEQRLQTMYYDWGRSIRPPVSSMFMSGGPDSKKGVKTYMITNAMRFPLMDSKWNPYMHPDTYSNLKKDAKAPSLHDLPPLAHRRKAQPSAFFAYGVSRIDGADAEEAKRLIDYSLYATKYLRPEMDCRVRSDRAGAMIPDMIERMRKADDKGLWGDKELETLGFKSIKSSESQQGLPFLVRPRDDISGQCTEAKPDWKQSGFYPGGMERTVYSGNGWNDKNAAIWQYMKKGVTVSACGVPVMGGGGPHITNATFWDNRILMKYLFRGRDLGECFLLSTIYINWSTSLIGDPLMHPDLSKTVVDRTPPESRGGIAIKQASSGGKITLDIRTELKDTPDNPEVAVMKVVCRDGTGKEVVGVSPLYSRRPRVVMEDLLPATEYTLTTTLIDPYGNRTDLLPSLIGTMSVSEPTGEKGPTGTR